MIEFVSMLNDEWKINENARDSKENEHCCSIKFYSLDRNTNSSIFQFLSLPCAVLIIRMGLFWRSFLRVAKISIQLKFYFDRKWMYTTPLFGEVYTCHGQWGCVLNANFFWKRIHHKRINFLWKISIQWDLEQKLKAEASNFVVVQVSASAFKWRCSLIWAFVIHCWNSFTKKLR